MLREQFGVGAAHRVRPLLGRRLDPVGGPAARPAGGGGRPEPGRRAVDACAGRGSGRHVPTDALAADIRRYGWQVLERAAANRRGVVPPGARRRRRAGPAGVPVGPNLHVRGVRGDPADAEQPVAVPEGGAGGVARGPCARRRTSPSPSPARASLRGGGRAGGRSSAARPAGRRRAHRGAGGGARPGAGGGVALRRGRRAGAAAPSQSPTRGGQPGGARASHACARPADRPAREQCADLRRHHVPAAAPAPPARQPGGVRGGGAGHRGR